VHGHSKKKKKLKIIEAWENHANCN